MSKKPLLPFEETEKRYDLLYQLQDSAVEIVGLCKVAMISLPNSLAAAALNVSEICKLAAKIGTDATVLLRRDGLTPPGQKEKVRRAAPHDAPPAAIGDKPAVVKRGGKRPPKGT